MSDMDPDEKRGTVVMLSRRCEVLATSGIPSALASPFTTREQRWRLELMIPRFAEIAELVRQYAADPSDETAEEIDALFDEVHVLTGRGEEPGP